MENVQPQHNVRLAVIMVGLPARGKTYIARKTARYLAWLGYVTRIFNVGNYRRDLCGASVPHDFFDPRNDEYTRRRAEVALTAMDDMLRWFGVGVDESDFEHQNVLSHSSEKLNISLPHSLPPANPNAANSTNTPINPAKLKFEQMVKMSKPLVFRGLGIATSTSDLRARATVPGEGAHGGVAVYDATNSTRERRKAIIDKLKKNGIQIMFVESICENEEVVMSNIREVKISSPDYVGVDPDLAALDFMQRIKHYEVGYQPVSAEENDGDMPFVKLVNVGSQVIVNKIRGYLQSRIVYFLMNLNITPRHIYFSRHGESMYNVEGKIGGDSDLSPRGRIFAKKLPELIAQQIKKNKDTQLTVWNSTLRRTIQTAENLPYQKIQWKILDEIDAGVCDGYTYEEINKMYPNDYIQRDADKYNYRYIGGESYRDMVQRLEPIIMELERHHEPGHSILIIGHQAVLRCIYAYYLNYSHEELPYLKIPLHTVVKITPKAYGCIEERFTIDVPAVNTHRDRGASPNASPTLPHTWPDIPLTRLSPSLPQLSSISPTTINTITGNLPGSGVILPGVIRTGSPLKNTANGGSSPGIRRVSVSTSVTTVPTNVAANATHSPEAQEEAVKLTVPVSDEKRVISGGHTGADGGDKGYEQKTLPPHVVATEEVLHSEEGDITGAEDDEQDLEDELGEEPLYLVDLTGPEKQQQKLDNLAAVVGLNEWNELKSKIVGIDDDKKVTLNDLLLAGSASGSGMRRPSVPVLKEAPKSRTGSRQNSVSAQGSSLSLNSSSNYGSSGSFEKVEEIEQEK
ncbi:Fructose-2,6-bisphosphatase [Nowakowskiella sp. JEL0407]|nr:Fructose-2,6-bisphosphatase [Nowakowskiella sp. JEL0407]